uniref:Uncharacterized protein n=1 Tax=Rhipicephalus microplus TaxID=6941 RepID=A0A6G5AH94_RHIMP
MMACFSMTTILYCYIEFQRRYFYCEEYCILHNAYQRQNVLTDKTKNEKGNSKRPLLNQCLPMLAFFRNALQKEVSKMAHGTKFFGWFVASAISSSFSNGRCKRKVEKNEKTNTTHSIGMRKYI